MIVLLFIVVVNCFLGLLIFSRNTKSYINRLFIALTLMVSLWAITSYLTDHAPLQQRIIWGKLAFVMADLVIVCLAILSRIFPIRFRINKKHLVVILLLGLVAAVISMTNLVVNGAHYLKSGTDLIPGNLYYGFVLIVVLILGYGIYNYVRGLKRSNRIEKSQSIFVAIGFLSSFLWALLFNVILPQVFTTWNPAGYGPAGTVIFVSFTAYAIFRHKLFDIKLIVARAVAYTLTLGALAGSFTIITYFLLNVILDSSSIKRSTLNLIYTLLAVVIALTFPALRLFFNKVTNRVFYKDAYEPQAFLDEFNKVLVANYELHPLLNNSLKVIEENIKPTYAMFGIKETANIPRLLVGTSDRIKFDEEDIAYVRKITPHMNRKLIIVDELEDKYKELQEVLRRNNAAIIARIATEKDVEGTGYLILGPKKSGNVYSKQDIQVIEILANELVIAIQNSLRFEEIQGFNATLQQKVNDATYKLRKANERLKVLDETKDDFISMASHQLRTPLTSIKGYLSMILEGDAGKVNHTQQDMLGQAFFSSQRMVYLIADMLNVSRLKTGKFAIENSQINLAEVVEQEMQQLKETAEVHGVSLSYHKPKEFPDLLLDETKIRQVVMNFADNAIYYTPKGGKIVVDLKDNPGTIELRVIDDGIGVPKSERHHLFTKFYRAGNARKVRPDGTGLGLFMAKKVIMAQGGSIIFESEEGKGSTFGFIINKKTAPPKSKTSPAHSKKVAQTAKV